MKKTILYMVLAILCPFLTARGQDINPLKIGDTIPEALWNTPLQVVNHPDGKDTITLNDYRGKLIILDFWATWCSACLAGIPNISDIQKKYGNKLKTILVTIESADKVSSFIKTNHIAKKENLWSVTSNILNKYFPTNSIPHYVWILPNGEIMAFTGANQITEKNILQTLQNSKEVKLIIKDGINLNRAMFLSSDFKEVNKELLQYSIFIKGDTPELPYGSIYRIKRDTLYGICSTNRGLLDTYKFLAHELFKQRGEIYTGNNRMIIESDPLGQLTSNEVFSYDVIVPINKSQMLYTCILNTINLGSGYYGRIEKRKIPGLILVSTGSSDILKSKSEKKENTFYKYNPGKISNMLIDILPNIMGSSKWLNLPIVNKTGIEHKIDITLSISSDLKDLQVQLKKYNLDLLPSELEMNMFVITYNKDIKL